MKTILAISPHTDDSLFGAGATMAKWVEQGHTVYEVALSFIGRQDLLKEFHDACAILGVIPYYSDFPVRCFSEHRQKLLDGLIEYRGKFQPDLVLCPCSFDTHQDHRVVYEETLRAFKGCSIYGYEEAWNTFTMSSDIISKVELDHVSKKRMAIEAFKSQRGRPYSNPDYTISNLTSNGIKIGCNYAEVFECIRRIEL